MITASILILALYLLLIGSLILGFGRVKEFKPAKNEPLKKFSIVVPFRNEEENLSDLLNSLSLLNYPHEMFEILLVNDASEDDSVKLVERFKSEHDQLKLILLNNHRKSTSPKKDAIEIAIQQANFHWILCTDADCKVPVSWLQAYNSFILENRAKLIVGPVNFNVKSSIIEQFQLLDLLSLQGATIGGFGLNHPFLCNGANLLYSKEAFNEIDGFRGNEHIASGDDIFLLEKMAVKYPKEVHFLKTRKALVSTRPQRSIKGLLNQRVRWASKARSFKNNFSKITGLVVLAMNSWLLVLLAGSLLNVFPWAFLATIFIIKVFFDFILLLRASLFYKASRWLWFLFPGSIIYPFFIMFVALTSFTGSYSWKGRRFKQ